MPSVEQNLAVWESGWDWSREGDEWSDWWGGTPALWCAGILPRIHSFVPTGTILEIAPGYGRCTQYLKDLGERLVVIDLAGRCIEHCRERFADARNIEYHVNDGRSLAMLDDASIDFVFSYDSLVHAEADVIGDYLSELSAKLKPDGVGFIHHSNIGGYRRSAAVAKRMPPKLASGMIKMGLIVDVWSWRAESMIAETFVEQCEQAGLACIAQEKINWQHGRYLTDAFSVFTPRGSRRQRPLRVVRNAGFRAEAKRATKLYAP